MTLLEMLYNKCPHLPIVLLYHLLFLQQLHIHLLNLSLIHLLFLKVNCEKNQS